MSSVFWSLSLLVPAGARVAVRGGRDLQAHKGFVFK